MPQTNAPSHPGNQPQGLEPAPRAEGNQYFTPNAALQQAQAATANAEASKLAAETAILNQGLGNIQQQGPSIEEQAGIMANDIANGNIGMGDIQALVQSGQIDPNVADTAVSMLQQAQAPQQQGLGAF